MRSVLSFSLIILVLLSLSPVIAAPQVKQTEDHITIKLDTQTTLTFSLHKQILLGLNQVTINGTAMKSDLTVQRPLLAQEYNKPWIWPYLQLDKVYVKDNKVHIECTLLGGNDQALFEDEFVFKGNHKKALENNPSPSLLAAKAKAEQAKKMLEDTVEDDPSLDKLKKQLERAIQTLAKDDKAIPFLTQRAEKRISRLKSKIADKKKSLYTKLAQGDEKLSQALADIATWKKELDKAAIANQTIHRDFYAFAHTRLPAETSHIARLKKQYDKHAKLLKPGGKLTWTFEPVTRNIAGWQWQGWSKSYSFTLEGEHRVNNIRQLGTWEIGGKAPGLTVVSMRFRGVGSIEQQLEAREEDNAVKSMWTTTEIIPHAAGRAALISPVIVNSDARDLTDRDYARRHRIGAWIGRLPRGAGMSFVDFQKRDNAILISYREKQGNYRALTEVLPGDHQLSQTDEEWFANITQYKTEPVLYLALVQTMPIPLSEMRTRWQEVDQYVRDIVSEELGFVQVEPLPGIGKPVEMGRAPRINGLHKGVKK